ncbi:UNVERIFIED_ORG: AAA15 family ATPase/GTPase [Methylorubrum zatmanii]
MLIRFTAENILCFKEEVSMSLVASSDDKHINHVLPGKSDKVPRLLRASAVYGANGHGKTKIVEAINFMKELVVNGTDGDDPINVPTFRLDSTYLTKPTKLVIEFRIGDRDYEYGITFTKSYICEEWLFYTDLRGKEKPMFERVTTMKDKNNYENKFKFGSAMLGMDSPSKTVKTSVFLEVLASGTRKNQPFLKDAVERKVIGLEEVYDWFDNILSPVTADSVYSSLFQRAKTERSFVEAMSEFMCNADVGIHRMDFDEFLLDSNISSILPPSVLKEVEERISEDRIVEVGTRDGSVMIFDKNKKGQITASRIVSIRKDDAGKEVKFSMHEESSGTRRLLDLIPMLTSEDDRRVYIVDELDRKLHPVLARKFIEIFLKSNTNQLIYTTHNTYLLDLDLLRRDEIWFVQKKRDGSSEIYSLSDLKIRPDLDVRKGYLNGRFGAIPFAGNTQDLGWPRVESGGANAHE